jgi:hypothetical protein
VLFWGQTPFNNTCGCYKLPLNANQAYTIKKSSFKWPAFNVEDPPSISALGSGTLTTFLHHDIHRLGFDDFKPAAIQYKISGTQGKFCLLAATWKWGQPWWKADGFFDTNSQTGRGEGFLMVTGPAFSASGTDIPEGNCNTVYPTGCSNPHGDSGVLTFKLMPTEPGIYNFLISASVELYAEAPGGHAQASLRDPTGSRLLDLVAPAGGWIEAGISSYTTNVITNLTVTVIVTSPTAETEICRYWPTLTVSAPGGTPGHAQSHAWITVDLAP